MKRLKIGNGYYQSGHGKGFKKNPNIYLIKGKLYAKDKAGSECDSKPLTGELKGYVRVNLFFHPSLKSSFFAQCNEEGIKGYKDGHKNANLDELELHQRKEANETNWHKHSRVLRYNP